MMNWYAMFYPESKSKPKVEFLPCPFCGHTDITVFDVYETGWRLRCEYCEAQVVNFCQEDEAIKAWNTRVETNKDEGTLSSEVLND